VNMRIIVDQEHAIEIATSHHCLFSNS